MHVAFEAMELHSGPAPLPRTYRSGKPSRVLKFCSMDVVEQLKRSCYHTQLN
jgi:hypothetical protein